MGGGSPFHQAVKWDSTAFEKGLSLAASKSDLNLEEGLTPLSKPCQPKT
jgi:hypothetical protein